MERKRRASGAHTHSAGMSPEARRRDQQPRHVRDCGGACGASGACLTVDATQQGHATVLQDRGYTANQRVGSSC